MQLKMKLIQLLCSAKLESRIAFYQVIFQLLVSLNPDFGDLYFSYYCTYSLGPSAHMMKLFEVLF